MRKYDIRRLDGKARSSSPTTQLYTIISKAKPFLHLKINTKVEVNVAQWLSLTKGKKLDRLHDWYHGDGKEIYSKLSRIDTAINDILASSQALTEDLSAYDTDYIKREINKAIDAIVGADRRKEIETAVAELQKQKKREENTFIKYLKQYVSDIQFGKRMQGNAGQPYTAGTRRIWCTFGKVMTAFHKKTPFNWNDIDRKLIDRYIRFLMDEGYSTTTINKHITNFRKYMNDASLEGHHDINVTMLFKNKKATETASKKKTAIYLTEDELEELYKMPLEGRFKVSRDAFLVGCYTCQGFAEFSRISKVMLYGEDKDVIRTERQKTGTSVRIPTNLQFRYNHLTEILDRYDNDMTSLKLYEQHINDDIKVILEKLSASVPSLAEPIETMLTKTEREQEKAGKVHFDKTANGKAIKPKYALVSTHTARRSGITNLLLTDTCTLYDLMRYAGHSDVKQTIEYIKLSGEEIAEFLERHHRVK